MLIRSCELTLLSVSVTYMLQEPLPSSTPEHLMHNESLKILFDSYISII